MKIRLLKSFANPDVKMKAGTVIDLPDVAARFYVEHGKAEYLEFEKVEAEAMKRPVIEKAVIETRETAVIEPAHDDFACTPEKKIVAEKVTKPKKVPAKRVKK